MTKLFSQTLREAPANADVVSHQLLLRAGYIRQLGTGIFSYLPLARRSLSKVENIMRQEINAIDGQEITMPVVQPADIWMETKRWYQIGSEMGRFQDKNGHDMALAMTHEEVVGDLVRKEIRSYRQLPALIYHLQTKWRDDPRPRAGLIRVREFTMLDSYSLDTDWDGLDAQYRAHYQAYFNIYNRCNLPVIAVKSDVGMMGGKLAHEFMYLTPIGEDTLMICDHCGYTANRQVAVFRKQRGPDESPLPIQKVPTPGVTTIDDLAAFLNIPTAKTAKAVFAVASVMQADVPVDKFVFAVVRGDMEVNETKLSNAIKARDLRPAQEDEIRAIGAVPGYGSPLGVHDAIIVVDDAVAQSPNLVAGANETGYHLLNVNYGRDYGADVVCDIAAASEGDACPRCSNPLRATRGVEVGNIFQLGTRYSDAMGCTFLDAQGQKQPVIMGSYGIGVGRLLACIAEEHHDEMGLCWPITVAPYQVHLILLRGDDQTAQIANRVYGDLQAAGIEVLYDDREERPGVKFMDADLIGLPLRLTVGDRALKRGGLELKQRRAKDSAIVPLDETVSHLKAQIDLLHAEIASHLQTVTYETGSGA
ncbi:MAG: proline--tRNA ligase [Chloroflexi bacterium]|nr:proline--tRNA ligase [Chloroflexota bacterium]